MSTKDKDNNEDQSKGTAKEKATFDQNGKGASDKYGAAGSTPNESADEDGTGTAKKQTKK
ncbi:hypothetical protein GJU39_17655 [Pedobacter petrophilus]|jgi:hypothetical protein|uniref:Uncharacterized protein n=1 Tax=Pedobacter petrophilus TaxID=1908241 RepID=A0A7K0G2L0_9SPHI|nr:hypothetical protein [Pedobacter petrophilus]MRX77911.1 hypothetical protein [Pedobacter petrophilus]